MAKNKDNGELLKQQSSVLVTIVACMSVLMVITYFSFSFTTKGTYSADADCVVDAVTGECVSVYPKITFNGNGSGIVNCNGAENCTQTCTSSPCTANWPTVVQKSGYTLTSWARGNVSNCGTSNSNEIKVDSTAYNSTTVSSDTTFYACWTSTTTCNRTYTNVTDATVEVTLSRVGSGCSCPTGFTETREQGVCSIDVTHANNSYYFNRGDMTTCPTGYSNNNGICTKCESGYTYSNGSCVANSSSENDDITCEVTLSCDSTVVAGETINVKATVKVFDAGTALSSGGTAYLSTHTWTSGGPGISGGGTSSKVASSLIDTVTFTANNAVGQTINVSYKGTLSNGKTCTASKTITVVACTDCGPSSSSPSVNPGTSKPASSSTPTSAPSSSSLGYTDKINEDRCYMPGKKVVYVTNCQPGTTGARCETSIGNVDRMSLGDVTNSACKSASNVTSNPETSTVAIIIAWIVGIIAIGYAFLYFKQVNSTK